VRALHGLALAGVLAAAGCYAGPGTDDPTAKGGSPLPLGVATPAPGLPAPGPVEGIFASAAPDDPNCCWMGKSASFPVRAPAGTSRLVLQTFVPDLNVFRERVQGADVRVDGGPVRHFAGLAVGRHVLEVPFPRARRDRLIRVSVEPAFTFVPIQRKITPDGRTLSLYLRDAKVLR
jgi:hypothetical protein